MKGICFWSFLVMCAVIMTVAARSAEANEYLRMELVVYTETGVHVYDVSEDECYAVVGELGEVYDTVAFCIPAKRTVI